MRYEQEILEKIMYYDREGFMCSFPLYVFRTKEKVNRKALETAVERSVLCHPLFGCKLSEDEKGPYWETNYEKPLIPDLSPEEEFFYGNASSRNYPWLVGIHDKDIIYTGYHALADGIGAMMFMNTVLYYYFKEQGVVCDPGRSVTLDDVSFEYLEKNTECSVRKNGAKASESFYKPDDLRPSVFPDEMLEEHPSDCPIRNFSISLADIKGKCSEYGVTQFAVLSACIAHALFSVLPGADNVVLMNIIADMRRILNSVTTHNCVMSVPIAFSQCDFMSKSEELQCEMFRHRLNLGFNRDEVLRSCFNSSQMERQIGGSREYLEKAAEQIVKNFAFNLPVASVTYTHLTHTGLSDEIFNLLDDVYINYSGYKKSGKQGISALNLVTTDKAVNMMIIDGTKNSMIVSALEKRLEETHISFKCEELEKYKGIIYKR